MKKASLLAMGTAVSLVLLEGVARVATPWYHPGRQILFRQLDGVPLGTPNATVNQMEPDRFRRVEVAFNRYGFRDDKDLKTAQPSDWFVVGDSFSFGWGVEERDRFSSILDSAAPFRVFNVSIPTDIAGYEKLLEYAKRNGARIEHLIVGVCMENDLLGYDEMAPRDDASPASGKERLRAWMKTHSAAYLLVSNSVKRSHRLRRVFEALGVIRTVSEFTRRNPYDPLLVASAVERLRAIHAVHPEMLVLVIPARGLWTGDNRDAERRMHELFIGELDRAGIETVDMRPAFEAAPPPLRHYFATDGHWNQTGHRKCAEVLLERIVAGGAPLSTRAPAAMGHPP